MPWLIGLAILVAAGWYASKKAGGISNLLHLGSGSTSTIHNVNISSSTLQGGVAQVSMAPGDSLVVSVYDPPAGYVWTFAPSGLTLGTQTPTSATFTLPAGSVGGAASAALFKSPNAGAFAPMAAFSVGVVASGAQLTT